MLLCADAKCENEMLDGCSGALAGESVLAGWGEANKRFCWCSRANWDNGTTPPKHAGLVLVGLEKLIRFGGCSWPCDWKCEFLFWCCEASSDREMTEAGCGTVTELDTTDELCFEYCWIKSANDGPPLGLAILAWNPVPTPCGCWLLLGAELRMLNPEGATGEELAVVTLQLPSDRLLSGPERREGAELWEAEDMCKVAKVPNERLFWFDMLDGNDLGPLVRALNDGTPEPCTTPAVLLCKCSGMSCARLVPPTTERTPWWVKLLLSELLTAESVGFCDKRSRKVSALAWKCGCTCIKLSVWGLCALDEMSVWEADKQAPYLTEANWSWRRGEQSEEDHGTATR